MSNFIPKKISEPLNPGEKLKLARLEKNWKLEDIAKYLNIKKEYLFALEENQLNCLPSGLYGKNFITRYAKLLAINPMELLQEWQLISDINKTENPFSRKKIARRQLIVLPKLIRNFFIIISIAICFLYLLFYFRQLVTPPKLIIIYPEENLALNSSSVKISGQTEAEAEIRVNGEIVLNNNQGYFEQEVSLKKGLNNLIIRAKKKYSQEQIINRQILVE